MLSSSWQVGMEKENDNDGISEWNTTLFRATSRHLKGKTEVRTMGRPIV